MDFRLVCSGIICFRTPSLDLRVNTIAPGFIQTSMTAKLSDDIINQYLQKDLSIDIEYEENLISPEVKEERKKQKDANNAFVAADSDENINNIKKYFDAEIDKEFIKKINDN